MQSNDKARLQYLSSLALGRPILPIASGVSVTHNPTYVVRVGFGTPAQTLLLALDTGTNAAWVPCSGCLGCSSAIFDSTKSSTFKTVACGSPQCSQVPHPSCGGNNCGFSLTYCGDSNLTANLVQDSLTLADYLVARITFGCIQNTAGPSIPAQGLLGLGRGPISLISQTPSIYQSTFSYCLPSYNSSGFTGSLKLGPKYQPVHIKSTPLLKNPRRPSLYYVNVLAIRVGAKVVNIPPSAFALDPNTGGGTIFDIGVVYTTLVQPAYAAVRDEFRRRMGNATVSSLGIFDTCYTAPIPIPSINFKFDGMNVTLPRDNFLLTSGGTTCLAMAGQMDGTDESVLNVIGSFQQQNHRIMIDEPNSRLCVAREPCS
ncbi:aspartyl protease AED3-like [Primulina eburnea]|uniref:aspartyl protease AED3-like n=1 Tax=Primulina eburnea TaxID=1245227 RepID=UPI003C6C3F98